MQRLVAAGLVVVAAAQLVASPAATRQQDAAPILVAAAASLSGVAPVIAKSFRAAGGGEVRFNFAGSNTLARQIVEGARVDAFLSADASQMDVVERAQRVVAGSRVDVIGNQLMVITPATGTTKLAVTRAHDLSAAGVRRIAMGDPGGVPAGVYGKRWLERAGAWAAVQRKVVPLPSSPAVVAAVAEGRADAGIVYVSDAHQRSTVTVAYRVPLDDAPAIVYPAAVIAGGQEAAARRFLAHLMSETAQQALVAAGFRRLGSS